MLGGAYDKLCQFSCTDRHVKFKPANNRTECGGYNISARVLRASACVDRLSVLLPSGSKDWKWGKAVSRMIRNVIFDIGGVFIEWDRNKAFREFGFSDETIRKIQQSMPLRTPMAAARTSSRIKRRTQVSIRIPQAQAAPRRLSPSRAVTTQAISTTPSAPTAWRVRR